MKVVKEYNYKGTRLQEENKFKRIGSGIADFFDGYGDLAKSFIKEADDSIHANITPNFFILIGFPIVFPLVMGGAVIAKLGYVASKPLRNIYDNHCAKKEFKMHCENGEKLYIIPYDMFFKPAGHSYEKERKAELAREVAKMNVIEKNEIVKKVEEEKKNIDLHEIEAPDHGLQLVKQLNVYDSEKRPNYDIVGEKITLQDIHNVNKPKTYKYVKKGQ